MSSRHFRRLSHALRLFRLHFPCSRTISLFYITPRPVRSWWHAHIPFCPSNLGHGLPENMLIFHCFELIVLLYLGFRTISPCTFALLTSTPCSINALSHCSSSLDSILLKNNRLLIVYLHVLKQSPVVLYTVPYIFFPLIVLSSCLKYVNVLYSSYELLSFHCFAFASSYISVYSPLLAFRFLEFLPCAPS